MTKFSVFHPPRETSVISTDSPMGHQVPKIYSPEKVIHRKYRKRLNIRMINNNPLDLIQLALLKENII